ncbi:MAG: response regulator [Lachnospiraceae bacterium]|nr:response regulator [Lachnospiraceae bacterium]
MVIANKDTFLVRVLMNKLTDAGFAPVFVPYEVDEINREWEETALIAIYMDSGEIPRGKVQAFLSDKLTDDAKQLILIGDQNDVQTVRDSFPEEAIYQSFIRPINNEVFVEAVREVLGKVASGEFKKSILIVDDDPSYLGLVREWLKQPYKVSMVTSGLQAIKWLGKNKADLILLDYEMPVTSGPQVLEMLRSDDETRSIPVIFLTGRSDKESVMSVLALKPEGYLLKNIEKEELLEKLNDFFMRRSGV